MTSLMSHHLLFHKLGSEAQRLHPLDLACGLQPASRAVSAMLLPAAHSIWVRACMTSSVRRPRYLPATRAYSGVEKLGAGA